MMLLSIQYAEWYVLLLCIVGSAGSGLRCPLAASPEKCAVSYSGADEYFFKIEGGIDLQINYDPKSFYLTCPENITLESEFLPTFDQLETFSYVKLSKCPPPSHSYREILHSLNISVRSFLDLTFITEEAVLKANLFESLNISTLWIAGDAASSIPSEPSFLEPLPALADLRLAGVALDPDAVLRLPPTLRRLKLENTGIVRLPPAAFARLDRLDTLFVTEKNLTSAELSGARRLLRAELTAPLDGLTLGPALENLTLIGARGLELRGDCSALRVLHVQGGDAPLPDRWLARCAVRDAQVSRAGAGRAAGEWRGAGAGALRTLNQRYCRLQKLPDNWLEDAYNLEYLDLSYNEIDYLPRELFSRAARLRHLDLAHNRLARGAAAALSPLRELRWLALADNPLGNLCEVKDAYVVTDSSPLRSLRALEHLGLARSGATALCLDWRTELLRLAELDLRGNNITELRFEDTQWRREGGVHVAVDLRGAPVTSLVYSRADYAHVLASAAPSALAELEATWRLSCDCEQYWVARALSERPEHAPALRRARCASDVLLAELAPRDLTCAVAAASCPAGCACAVSPEHTALRCAGAGLRALPPVDGALPPVTELLVPANNISALDPRRLADFANLAMLDISNNTISTIDAETVAALFAERRRVLLAGNPLRCDCGALALLRAIAERPASVPDLARARCDDPHHTPLAVAAARAPAACAPDAAWPAAAAAAAAVLLLSAVLMASALARPAVRARLKLFLFERGLCLRWLLRAPDSPDDDGTRLYDAFVSFSQLDCTYAHELAARLESAGWRLCLHERDWTPGEWIPAQIARSVREARRTLVLVSENFLRSEWARAELREAYGAALGEARPRLLVLLLPGCAPEAAAAAAPELRAYLAAVTYLRWDDARFWSRLCLALPPPRPAPAAAPVPARAPHHTPTAA